MGSVGRVEEGEPEVTLGSPGPASKTLDIPQGTLCLTGHPEMTI